MKGTFYVPLATMHIEDVLKKHEPYATMAISTTGLDNLNFSDHSPIRVCINCYEYDAELNNYKTSFEFDKLVQAPKSAIDVAVSNEKYYDVFAKSGIDKKAYIDGTNVLTVEDFQKEYNRVFDVLKEKDALLIANGKFEDFMYKYMDKIGCGKQLRELNENSKYICQEQVTSEFLQAHNQPISGRGTTTLAALSNYFTPVSPNSIINTDKNLASLIDSCEKDVFFFEHPNFDPKTYEATKADFENRRKNEAVRTVGTNSRCAFMANVIKTIGEEKRILSNTKYAEANKQYNEKKTQNRKENYASKSLEEKLDVLVQMGKINPADIEIKEDSYHRLMEKLTERNLDEPDKGITILHVATNGKDVSKEVPIQICAVFIPRNDKGIVDFNKEPQSFVCNIRMSNNNLLETETKIREGKFDPFKFAGIDINAYKNDKNYAVTPETALNQIDNFMKQHQSTIITIGDRYAQQKIQQIGNLSLCSEESFDAIQLCQDYTYITFSQDKSNEIVDMATFDGNFKLSNLAKLNDIDISKSTIDRCYFVRDLIATMEEQYINLNKDKFKNIEINSSEQTNKSEDKAETKNYKEIETPITEESFADFVEEDDITHLEDAFADEDMQYELVQPVTLPAAKKEENTQENNKPQAPQQEQEQNNNAPEEKPTKPIVPHLNREIKKETEINNEEYIPNPAARSRVTNPVPTNYSEDARSRLMSRGRDIRERELRERELREREIRDRDARERELRDRELSFRDRSSYSSGGNNLEMVVSRLVDIVESQSRQNTEFMRLISETNRQTIDVLKQQMVETQKSIQTIQQTMQQMQRFLSQDFFQNAPEQDNVKARMGRNK